ncbi:uncharacterized protein LOC120633396 [Pararge aegeria]|uniref:uncharacterized protein LOC120633396 n=1 Tax=Pararge aegeria TaxID=116150 RepID=UPI0019D31DFF|nr:uncharacterized protein LOC120633396 [Pararge aegeria]
MAISGCSNGLLVTALVTLLLLPVHYYLPGTAPGKDERQSQARPLTRPLQSSAAQNWFLLEFPVLDLVLTASLLLLALMTYLFDWIQRKMMERRLMKLNEYLGACVRRLRGWDARQEQLEATLRMVQSATSEYNLLLYLLLRRHRAPGGDKRLGDGDPALGDQ